MKKVSQKRIEKISKRKLRSFSYIAPWILLPLGYSSHKACIHVLKSVYKNFIKLQADEKKGKTHIPVIYVDTPVDDKIPFTPEKVSTYLDFVPYFISPLSMLIKRFGLKKARPMCAEYLDFIAELYENASSIYRFCMTTTHRPNYTANKKFAFIYRNDPHYLCVPSLHICIVAGCYSYFRELFEKEDFTPNEKKQWNEELFNGAVSIADSVLYVKQHSVNCIPSALYMMTTLFPHRFTIHDAVHFIDSLFTVEKNFSEEDRKEIIAHIHFMYERLLLEDANSDDWHEPVRRWLISHARKTGQSFFR